jgi:hypothetical protein
MQDFLTFIGSGASGGKTYIVNAAPAVGLGNNGDNAIFSDPTKFLVNFYTKSAGAWVLSFSMPNGTSGKTLPAATTTIPYGTFFTLLDQTPATNDGVYELQNIAGTPTWINVGPMGNGSTITSETIDDRVAALMQSGDGIALVYDDTANTLTVHLSEVSGLSASVVPFLSPVYLNTSGDLALAQGNAPALSRVAGLSTIAASATGDPIRARSTGSIKGTAAEWTAVLGSTLVPGETYLLDPSTPGKIISSTAYFALVPTMGWQYVEIGTGITSTEMLLKISAPSEFA